MKNFIGLLGHLTALLTLSSCAELPGEQLLFVSAVWRHGARAPDDPASEAARMREVFPYGLNELTENGIKNSYELGKFLQYRYIDDVFLSRVLNNKEVYFQSVDVNRCLMTATAVAQGMFSDPSRSVPLPVPVHTRPLQNDWLLAFPWYRCPALQREFTKYCDFPDIRRLEQFQKYTLAGFECSGARGKYFNDTETFNRIEGLIAEELAGGPLPSWYTPEIRAEARALYAKVQRFHLGVDEYHNPAILRLTVGQLFDTIQKEIIHKWNCVHRVNDPSCKAINPLKFKQDFIISSLLEVLGARKEALANALNPQYNSVIIFELWSVQGLPMIKILYKRGSHTSQLVNLSGNVRNCQGVIACPLEQFAACCDPFKTSNPQSECVAPEPADRIITHFPGNSQLSRPRETDMPPVNQPGPVINPSPSSIDNQITPPIKVMPVPSKRAPSLEVVFPVPRPLQQRNFRVSRRTYDTLTNQG